MPRDKVFNPDATPAKTWTGVATFQPRDTLVRDVGEPDFPFVAGERITITGATSAANNRTLLITTAAVDQLQFDAASIEPLVDAESESLVIYQNLTHDPTQWDAPNEAPFDATGSIDAAGVRSISTDPNKHSGYGIAHMVDLHFDSSVAEDPAVAGAPRAFIDRDVVPGYRAELLRVEVSLNDGATWHPIPSPGGVIGRHIPGINPGDDLVNKQLLMRQVFAAEESGLGINQNPQLEALSAEVHFEAGTPGEPTSISFTDDVSGGSFYGCRYNPDSGRVEVLSPRGLLLSGNGYVRIKRFGSQLQLSHGDEINITAGDPLTIPYPARIPDSIVSRSEKEEFWREQSQDASFSVEFRIAPAPRIDAIPFGGDGDIDEGTIISWLLPQEALDTDAAAVTGNLDTWADMAGPAVSISLVNREVVGGTQLQNGLSIDLRYYGVFATARHRNKESKTKAVAKRFFLTSPRASVRDGDDLKPANDLFVAGGSYHVAVTFDGVWARVYVDGVLVAAGSPEPAGTDVNIRAIPEMRGDVLIGATWYPTSQRTQTLGALSASLDELRLWSRALSQGEVASRMSRELTTQEQTRFYRAYNVLTAEERVGPDWGLAAYYQFNDSNSGFYDPLDATANEPFRDAQGTVELNGVAVPGDGPTETQPHVGPVPGWQGLKSTRRGGVTPIYLPYRQSEALDLTLATNILRVTSAPFNIEMNGQNYMGVANMGSIESVMENDRGDPEVVQVTLSGLLSSNIAIALQQKYHDRGAVIYMAVIDMENGKVQGTPVILFKGRMDQMPISIGGDGESAISVTVLSELISWERAHTRRYTHTDQERRYPGDQGLRYVADMVDREVWWPAKIDV